MKINTHTTPYKQAAQSMRKGFTLIELLVVIAIIAVLASISYGPLMGYMNKGKITQARKVCKDIEIAVDAFKLEYSYLPYSVAPNTSDDSDGDAMETDSGEGLNVLKILMALDSSVNDKEIVYFTGKRAKSSKTGLNYSESEELLSLVDPWGNPYTFILDYNGDGKINTSDLNATFSGYQNLETISGTPGKDRLWGEGEDIKSW